MGPGYLVISGFSQQITTISTKKILGLFCWYDPILIHPFSLYDFIAETRLLCDTFYTFISQLSRSIRRGQTI